MTSIIRNASIVKPAVVILFDSASVRRLQNPAFGRLPQRDRKLPVGPSVADMEAVKGDCPVSAPTMEEAYGQFLEATLSPAEYRELRAEFESAAADRYAVVEPIADDEDAMLEAIAAAYDPTDYPDHYSPLECGEMDELRMLAPVAIEESFARPVRRRRRVNAAKQKRALAMA